MPCVLIVDPSDDNRETLSDLLEMAGFSPLALSSAEEALSMLRGGTTADIVLTELMLSGMDGPQLYDEMRSDALLASIPVLFVSSGATAGLYSRIPAEAVTHLKPYHFPDLLDAINRALCPRPAGVNDISRIGHDHVV